MHTQSYLWCSARLDVSIYYQLPRRDEGSDKPSATIEPHRIMVPTQTQGGRIESSMPLPYYTAAHIRLRSIPVESGPTPVKSGPIPVKSGRIRFNSGQLWSNPVRLPSNPVQIRSEYITVLPETSVSQSERLRCGVVCGGRWKPECGARWMVAYSWQSSGLCLIGLQFDICWKVVYKSKNLNDWNSNLVDGSA